MPLSESSNWNDLNYWNDTEVYADVTSVATVQSVVQKERGKRVNLSYEMPFLTKSGLDTITSDYELASIIPAGHMLDKVVIVETAGNACTVKGGNASAGAQWWAATACGASGITNIPVGLMLSATAAQSVFLTFTAGAGYSINIYLTIVKII
jgi:hypothetical protein